jgi:hypothetical protein
MLTLLGSATVLQQAMAQNPRYSRAEQERFMRRAAELRQRAIAEGDQGYGAVVKDGKIVWVSFA